MRESWQYNNLPNDFTSCASRYSIIFCTTVYHREWTITILLSTCLVYEFLNGLSTILYTDISCLGGVFAKNTSLETKFPSPFGSGNCSSLDWYFSQIPLPNMIYLYNIISCSEYMLCISRETIYCFMSERKIVHEWRNLFQVLQIFRIQEH